MLLQKERLDVFLFQNQHVQSRSQARDLIVNGAVSVNGQVVVKPSFEVSENDVIKLSKSVKYVGRGGFKLEKALACFQIQVKEQIVLDIGASTGGFTDCLLKNGAKKVFAVDVGHGQLDKSLVSDSRVVNLEGTHIKNLTKAMLQNAEIDIITTDVSFISLKSVIPYFLPFASEKTDIICLLKPQFEIGKTKKGIVRNIKDHQSVIKETVHFIEQQNCGILGFDFSPITGSDGNIEFLLHFKKGVNAKDIDFFKVAQAAHANK